MKRSTLTYSVTSHSTAVASPPMRPISASKSRAFSITYASSGDYGVALPGQLKGDRPPQTPVGAGHCSHFSRQFLDSSSRHGPTPSKFTRRSTGSHLRCMRPACVVRRSRMVTLVHSDLPTWRLESQVVV